MGIGSTERPSNCDFFKALSKAGKLGERVVVVKMGPGNFDVFADGRFLWGIGPPNLRDLALVALKRGEAIEIKSGDAYLKFEPVLVKPTLIVVGSGAVAKSIVELSEFLGYNLAIISDELPSGNAVYASSDVSDLEKIVDEDAIVIIASEGDPRDLDALRIAFKKGAEFVGLVASQRRAAYMVAQLIKSGVPLEEIARKLHAPLGLDIGARTPEEIAVSALSEVISYLRKGTGRALRDVKSPYVLLEAAMRGELGAEKCGK